MQSGERQDNGAVAGGEELGGLSARHIEILEHSLGNPRHYRNRFCTSEEGRDFEVIRELEALGLMERGQTIPGGSVYYHVTEAGMRHAFNFTTPLRAYMAWESHGGADEGAVLVFATTHRRARALAFPHISEWTGCDFTDVRARWLKSGCAHLRMEDGEHVVTSPPACVTCEKWHAEPLNDRDECQDCQEDRENEEEGTRAEALRAHPDSASVQEGA